MENLEKEIREKLFKLCVEEASWVDSDKINLETPFQKVVIDDLGFISLLINIESEFNVALEEGDLDLDTFQTLGKFIDWVIESLDIREDTECQEEVKDWEFSDEEKEILERGKEIWNLECLQKRKGGYVDSSTVKDLIDKVIENTWAQAREFYKK